MKKALLVFLLFIPVLLFSQVPEIPDHSLQDIAMVSWLTGYLPNGSFYDGPVILFNPSITNQVGPLLSSFFRAHEYGHIHHNHLQKRYFSMNIYNFQWMSSVYEIEADSYATHQLIQNNQIAAVKAAYMWFKGVQPFKNSLMHPAGIERARNIYFISSQYGINLDY